MMKVTGDLHIHTALSPCGSDEMNPVNIINMAELLEAKVIAVTDHNSTKNVKGVMQAAKAKNILVIPGVELTTKEEAHILCLFKDTNASDAMQQIIDAKLPTIKNKPEVFGYQPILDEYGDVVKEEERLLLNAVDMSVDDVVAAVKKLGGICIPAHVDRHHYSLLNNLGFIPRDLEFAALEISNNTSIEDFQNKHQELSHYTIIQSTDAHALRDMVNMKTKFLVADLKCEEIFMALQHQGGRRVVFDH